VFVIVELVEFVIDIVLSAFDAYVRAVAGVLEVFGVDLTFSFTKH